MDKFVRSVFVEVWIVEIYHIDQYGQRMRQYSEEHISYHPTREEAKAELEKQTGKSLGLYATSIFMPENYTEGRFYKADFPEERFNKVVLNGR